MATSCSYQGAIGRAFEHADKARELAGEFANMDQIQLQLQLSELWRKLAEAAKF